MERYKDIMYKLHNNQRMFYFFDKVGAGQGALLTGSVIIPRKIPVSELQAAANEVFRINDQMRVRFVEKEDGVYQEIKPYEKKELEVMRFESRDAMHEWCRGYGTIPLTLDRRTEGAGTPKSTWRSGGVSPVLVMNLLIHKLKMRRVIRKYGMTGRAPGACEIILFELPDECGAIVKMHHVISDAWTMLLIANQLLKILNGEHPEAYDYLDIMNTPDNYVGTDRYLKDVEFFEEQRIKCPESTRLWPGKVTTFDGSRSTKTLTEELTGQIKRYSEEHGVSLYVMFLTAAAVYMSRKLDRDMFYFGAIASSRSGVRAQNSVGQFVKQFPLLLELDQNESFADTLARIKSRSFAGYKHKKGYQSQPDSASYPYDLWVSFQDAVLSADTSAVVTQYYCNFVFDIMILTMEDRGAEGTFKLHFDHNRKVPESDADEMFETVIGVLDEGTADDSRSIGSLHR